MRRFALLLLLAGCAPTTAIVDGKPVPRLDMDFVGQPFVVRVSGAHPKPGSPSGGLRADGGRVSGNVCGLDLTFDVQHEGDKTVLTGFLDDGTLDTKLEVHDVDNISRVITGTLDSKGTGVNLDVRYNHIRGNVGLRQFDLGRSGDQYIGSVKITKLAAAATINGAKGLWELPPAAQAAVLPALLTCYGDELEGNLRGSLVVGFGGRQTWEGKHVSSVYHSQTADETRSIIQNSSSGIVGH